MKVLDNKYSSSNQLSLFPSEQNKNNPQEYWLNINQQKESLMDVFQSKKNVNDNIQMNYLEEEKILFDRIIDEGNKIQIDWKVLWDAIFEWDNPREEQKQHEKNNEKDRLIKKFLDNVQNKLLLNTVYHIRKKDKNRESVYNAMIRFLEYSFWYESNKEESIKSYIERQYRETLGEYYTFENSN